jgi:phytoene dehydrogenase-like protein
VLTYTHAPDVLSTGLFIEQLRLASKGVLYADGGWQCIVDGLMAAAERAGVRIVLGTKVEAVEHEDLRVTGVRLHDGSTLDADSVIIAAGPSEASQLLGDQNEALKKWAEQSTPVHFACLDIALKRLPNPERAVVIGMDSPLFFSAQSLYSKVAPEAGALAYSFKYLKPGDPYDAEQDKQELEDWLDLVQPGWRDELVEKRFLPRMPVTNSLISAAQGGTAGRPGPAVPGKQNLYVAGDWVGTSGMLANASLASARKAAQLIMALADQDQLKYAA